MNNAFHFKIDVLFGFLSFVGMVLGIIAFAGHIVYPWPVLASRLTVNAVTTLIIAGKFVDYVRISEWSSENETSGIVLIGLFSIIAIGGCFFFQKMGLLSTLFFIVFCAMGYADFMGKAPVTEEAPRSPQEEVN